MEPIIDLAPGASDSLLAVHLTRRIRRNLDDPTMRRRFTALRATVYVVDFDSGECISFRFDHGKLTVHEGPIGLPTVTFGGPRRALMGLELLRFRELPLALIRGRKQTVALVEDTGVRSSIMPPASSPPASTRSREKATMSELLSLFARGELKVYGLSQHPRTAYRFLKLIR